MASPAFRSSVVPLGLTSAPLGGALLPTRKTLKFVVQHQRQTQWCWAAVTSSVAAFYRVLGWPQCRLVNDRLGQIACCADGVSPTCNRPFYLDRALDRVQVLGTFTPSALTLAEVRAEIDAGHPIGVRIGWRNGGGHFIVVSGYSDQNVVDVQDPWFGASAVDYLTFRSRYQGSGRWTHTYRTVQGGRHNAFAARQSAAQRV